MKRLKSTFNSKIFAFGSLLLLSNGLSPAIAQEENQQKLSTTMEWITTESGLRYRDVNHGKGETVQVGDTVRVHYNGWLDQINGSKQFDSSYDRKRPLSFEVGSKRVIAGSNLISLTTILITLLNIKPAYYGAGWDETLLTNFNVGGKREVIIPSSLGYGTRGAAGIIPPDATLYFVIELLGLTQGRSK